MTKTEALDLHEISHEDVKDLVHQFINSNWRLNPILTIVTDRSERMKSIVRTVVCQYDLEHMTADKKNSGQMRLATNIKMSKQISRLD